jgi:TP901 family phage tail tape measure protein
MDRNVKLTGDSTSLVSALGEATKAMDAFTASAKNLQAGTKQLTSLSNIRPATLKGLGDSLKNIAEGGKALEKVKLDKVTNSINTLKGLKLSPKLAETITNNANSVNRFATALDTLQGVSIPQIVSNIKQLEKLKLDPNFPDKLKQTNAALRTLSVSAKGLQNLDIDKFASNIELFGAVKVDKGFATDIAKTATGLKELSIAAKRLEGVNIAEVNRGLKELAARKVDPKIADTLVQFAKGLQSVARASKTIQDIDLSKIAENVKSIGQGGSGDGVNQLISRLQKIEPILSKLSKDAKTLADNLNKIGVTKISQLSKNFEATSVSAKKLISDLKSGKRTFDDLSEAEKRVVSDFQKIVSANNESLNALKKTEGATKDINAEVRKLITQLDKGEISYEQMSKESQELVANVKRTAAANKQWLGQLTQVKKATNDINITWESIARYWVTGTVIGQVRQFSQAIRESVTDAAELSVKLAEIQTIARSTGGISENVLANQVRELSDQFTGSTLDQAEAFYQALSNGVVDAANAQQFLITSNKLALAAVTDVGDATNLLASVINSYSLETEEAARVSDVFFKAVEVGRFRLGEIANTLGRTTVLASQVGTSYDEVAATLAFLTKQGTTAANAQTLLRQVLLKLIKPTETMKGLLGDLGFESGEALVEAKGLGGALITLFQATQGGSSEIAKLFNNVRGLQGALALGKNGFEDYNEVLAQVSESSGAAALAADTISGSLGKNFLVAIENVQNALTQDLGGAILESLADADGSFDGIVDSIKSLINAATPLITTVASLAVQFKSLIVGLGTAAVALTAYKAAQATLIAGAKLFDFLIKKNTASVIQETTAVRVNSAVKSSNAIATGAAATTTGAYAAASGTAAVATTAAAVGTRAFSVALKGLLATTGVGLVLVAIGLAVEGIANTMGSAEKEVQDFNKRMQDADASLNGARERLARLTNENKVFIQSVRKVAAEIRSVYTREFNEALKGTVKVYEALIDKQSAFTNLFGEGIDEAASESVKLAKALDQIIEKTDELLGRGDDPDVKLLSGLDDELEILEARLEGLLSPFDELDNIAKRFDLVKKALQEATDPKTVNDLIGRLKSLSKEQASASIGSPTDISDAQVSRLKEINKLEKEALQRVQDRAKVNKTLLENQALQVNKTKEQIDRLKEGIVAQDKIGEAVKELRTDDKGEIIYDNTALGKSREAIKAIVDLLEKQIADTPQFADALEKTKGLYEEQLEAIREIGDANKESIKTRTQLLAVEKRLADAKKELVELQERETKASKESQSVRTSLAAIGGVSADTAEETTEGLGGALGPKVSREITNVFTSLEGNTVEEAVGQVFGVVSERARELADKIAAGAGEKEIDTFLQESGDEFFAAKKINEALANRFKELQKLIESDNVSDFIRKDAIKQLETLRKAVKPFGTISDKGISTFANIFRETGDQDWKTTLRNAAVGNVKYGDSIENARGKVKAASDKIKELAAKTGDLSILNKGLADNTQSASDALGGLAGVVTGIVDEAKRLNLIKGGDNPTKKYGGGRIYGSAGVDRVPAMLTAGEFVMPKDSTNKYLPLLESMRRGSYAPPQYYAQGGLVSQSGPQALDQSISVGDINVSVQSSGSVNAREIAQAINAEIRQGAIRMRR